MIDIEKKENCCGCNVCGDACPKGAISFKADNEGFLYPHIDLKLCINCGICEKVCPVINIDSLKKNDKAEPDCYAAMHKNIEIVFASTTGGMFSALADVMYRQGGYVGGAIHNEDLSVSQFISNDRHDIVKLRRSKDLQSNAEGFYSKVKNLLNNGEKVLVCGVPCQMAGLQAYLGREYENLLIVDLICLGVNSPKVWRKYIDSVEEKHGSKVIYTENKSKEYGWRNLTQKFVFANGSEAFETRDNSNFSKGFIETHLYCRPSCYECKFKGFPRIADITIGDFWGIEKFAKTMDKDIGTSLVMVNSKKGEEFFEKVKKRINFIKTPLAWALPGNPALEHPIAKSMINRNDFFVDLDKMPFDDVVNKYKAILKLVETVGSAEDALNKLNSKEWEFPLFAKLRDGSASIGIKKINSFEDIEELKTEPKYIYQPFIAGKEYGVDTFFDLKSGKLVSMFIKEKLAMRAGETDKAISVHSQNVIDEVLKVQNIKGLYGPIDIDVFVSNDGEVYINEINPRFGGGYPHAYGCGVNFMNLILNNLNGNENQVSLDSYKEGIMMLKYNGLYFKDTND